MSKIIKCPKCKAKIKNLLWRRTKRSSGVLSIDKDEYEDFNEEYDIFEEQKPYDFECPECDEVLFTDEDEAINFLKGEK